MTTPTVPSAADLLSRYQWEPQPRAQALVNELVEEFLRRCGPARELRERMKAETATRFSDWIDFIEVPGGAGRASPGAADLRARLADVGFTRAEAEGAPEVWRHEGGIFPQIVLSDDGPMRIGIKVDDVADFLAARRGAGAEIQGEPLTRLRLGRAFSGEGAELWVVERHGYRDFAPEPFDGERARLRLTHLERLCRRQREFETDAEGFDELQSLVSAAAGDLGPDLACDLFFESERRYWQRRNRAARAQKERQDRLGLGWANHDHHTYRSGRANFPKLIRVLETLGMFCRERFYAGAEAGWGAQVLEQAVTGIVVFADVDMAPEEVLGDFSHDGFVGEEEKLGTVGLWCALHGDSALLAGMHHLECQFDHAELVRQLESEAHIKTMAPFTAFPFLRQAFTEGERWAVSGRRVTRLLERGQITEQQAADFRVKGAIGSHLENLERNDGYKGFNQTGVSDIIARTDPRRLVAEMAAK
jgi:hypothetical protein